MTNKVGRPSQVTNNRDKLLDAARTLFVEKDYAQVSIREIATHAGTDAGLIRYYFGSKEALFATMIHETASPVMAELSKSNSHNQADGPANILQTYYRVMSAHPHFPRLIYKLASLDQSTQINRELTKILTEIMQGSKMMMFDRLQENGQLHDNVDPQCANLSFFSLMVFPFLAPDRVLNNLGIKITPEFLEQLAEQNSQLLSQGLFKKDANNE
ncbi:TetR/AcrR family transcriptional regulator [Shewanella gelidii]|nr:TetR/AcrR family transcriptional regulator [Shewanella gelidii]MCL1096876.1 TetR/AcrR family transcriptional regulator [Shewanella gelidii]